MEARGPRSTALPRYGNVDGNMSDDTLQEGKRQQDSHALLPAPEGPMSNNLIVGRESSEAMAMLKTTCTQPG